MDRYAFMADLVTLAADCVGNTLGGCPYEVFVSNGEPPADCSHIAARWLGGQVLAGSEKCLIKTRERFAVNLNRCCLKNIGEEFDPALEDDDAKCFVTDFGTLYECLICETPSVLNTFVRTCQEIVVRIAETERAPMGGCYGGEIMIEFTRVQPCCS